MEIGPFADVFPFEVGIFYCYVSLPEGSISKISFQHSLPRYCKSGIYSVCVFSFEITRVVKERNLEVDLLKFSM